MGIASKARKVQRNEIVIKAGLSRGTFRINPAAEKAKTVQASIRLATNIVPKGASKVPSRDEFIICCGARANSNQLGPPIIQSKCHKAAIEAIIPALTNNFD